jgi:hypothetical protein
MIRHGRARVWGVLLGGAVTVLLAACGGGGGGEPTYDRTGAEAAVLQGKQDLVDLLNSEPGLDPFPYDPLAGIGSTFQQAGSLDPTYDEAAFWSALFALVNFLESDTAKAFLARLGWEDLHTEFQDFAGRVGQELGAGFGSVSGSGGSTTGPPLHAFFVPNDPDAADDPDPCTDPQQPDVCSDPTTWVPFPVYVGGTDPGSGVSFISFQELYDFITGTLGNSVHATVQRLKAISSDFSTSLTAIPLGEADPITITFDRFEVDLLQSVYGLLDVVTALPTLWSYAGVDAFLSAHSDVRDPNTGDFTGSIPDDQVIAYFQNGMDGVPGGADRPLAANPAGVTRVKAALRDLLASLQGVFQRLASGDALADHLLTPATLFSTFDDQPGMAAYGSKALVRMLGDARATLDGPSAVTAFLPVATIQDFSTCDPLASTATDPAILNVAVTPPINNPTALTSSKALSFDGSGHATAAVPDGASTETDGAYYFWFTLDTPENVSIYTTSDDPNVPVDTEGQVTYLASGNPAVLAGWDSDSDSGEGKNFGISIAADSMADTPMTGLITAPMTFYVRVQNQSGGAFTLHVQATAPAAAWPAGVPIFLKGGGGRTFVASTYNFGALRVNSGAALSVVSRFWDLADRSTLTFIPDNPDTPNVDESQTILDFKAGDIRTSVLSILPDASFTGSSLDGLGDSVLVDLFSWTPDFSPGGTFMTGAPTVDGSFGQSATFCAYPKDLSTISAVPGGHLALPFF